MNHPESECRQYRCYLIHNGRIANAQELEETSIAEAIMQGRRLLIADTGATVGSGIEIWQRGELRYSDQRHASESGDFAPVSSPFQTADCTMIPTSHRSTSSSLAKLMFV